MAELSSSDSKQPRPISPARRRSDVYHAIGWTAATVWASWQGLAVLVIAEPSRPWHIWVSLGIWVFAALPLAVAAGGIWRLLILQGRRRRKERRSRGRGLLR